METIWQQALGSIASGVALVAVLRFSVGRELDNLTKIEKRQNDQAVSLAALENKHAERLAAIERQHAGIAATFATCDDLERLEDKFERRFDRFDR